jgi:hypothetical protein
MNTACLRYCARRRPGRGHRCLASSLAAGRVTRGDELAIGGSLSDSRSVIPAGGRAIVTATATDFAGAGTLFGLGRPGASSPEGRETEGVNRRVPKSGGPWMRRS